MTHSLRYRDRLESLHELAVSDTREHAESLLRGIDALTRKFANLGTVPLDVLDRYERILVAAHAANLLRLDDYSPRELTK